MTVVSQETEELYGQMARENIDYDFGISEGMGAAFDQGRRGSLFMSGVRQVQSIFDTSEKIDAFQANKQYGLIGTPGAFDMGDENVTVDRAKAVADDHYRAMMDEVILQTVNEDNPAFGPTTQFMASIAAGFTDPVSLGLNMAAGMGVGAIGSALGRSAMVSRVAPATGAFLNNAYKEGIQRGAMQFIAREGIENFIGSAAEEGLIQAMGAGDDRLAVKTDWNDSMRNIITGTVLGTGLGTLIQKEGRDALGRSFSSKWGDSASARVETQLIGAAMDAKQRVPLANVQTVLQDIEQFGFKDWHGTEAYKYSPAQGAVPNKLYISVGADGTAHRPAIHGGGTVLHDNINLAYNTGEKVIEYSPGNLRILTPADVVDAAGRHTPEGTKIATKFSDTVSGSVEPRQLQRVLDIVETGKSDLDVHAKQLDEALFNEGKLKTQVDDLTLRKKEIPEVTARYQAEIDTATTKLNAERAKLDRPARGNQSARKKNTDFIQENIARLEKEVADIQDKMDADINTRESGVLSLRSEIDSTGRKIVRPEGPANQPRSQLRARLQALLEGKNIDQMRDILDNLGISLSKDFNPGRLLEEYIDAENWNGYHFTGVNGQNQAAYNGVYVSPKAARKLAKMGETPSPKANPDQLAKYKEGQARMLKEHADKVSANESSMMAKEEGLGRVPETVDETVSPPKSPEQEVFRSSVERNSTFDEVLVELQSRVKENPDEELSRAILHMENIKSNVDDVKIVAEYELKLREYADCKRG